MVPTTKFARLGGCCNRLAADVVWFRAGIFGAADRRDHRGHGAATVPRPPVSHHAAVHLTALVPARGASSVVDRERSAPVYRYRRCPLGYHQIRLPVRGCFGTVGLTAGAAAPVAADPAGRANSPFTVGNAAKLRWLHRKRRSTDL